MRKKKHSRKAAATLGAIIAIAGAGLLLPSGCVSIDKSVHIHTAPFSAVRADVENVSETKADGNSLDAEAGVQLLP
jgi:hypothetical protein